MNIPAPTRNKIAKDNVDTNPYIPQVRLAVWKTPGWKDFANVFSVAMGWLFCSSGLWC
jgi:hypothetical protein